MTKQLKTNTLAGHYPEIIRIEPSMAKMLELYKVVADGETGLWRGVPAATGQQVSRDEWTSLSNEAPDHFQIVRLTAEEGTRYSMADEDIIERAVVVTWSDEQLH